MDLMLPVAYATIRSELQLRVVAFVFLERTKPLGRQSFTVARYAGLASHSADLERWQSG